MTPTIVRTVARAAVAFVFAWHGLVPKLLTQHPDELAPLLGAGFREDTASGLVTVAGFLELLLAAAMILLWRHRWPSWVALAFLVSAILGVAVTAPRLFLGAFNPLTLNVAVACLAVIDLSLLGPRPGTAGGDAK